MSKSFSIERRVTRSFIGLTLLLTICYAGIALGIAYVTEDEIIERVLADEITHLHRAYRGDGSLPSPRLGYMTLYSSIELSPPAVRRELTRNPGSGEIFTSDERHYHVRQVFFSDTSQALLVAEVSPLLVVTNLSANLAVVFTTLLALTLAISLWLAYRIARQTTRPILLLTDEVTQQRREQQPLALSAVGNPDEIGYLANTIQSTFNELRDALNRESHFTRDVSHELRTPLTIMKNSLSLMASRSAQPADIARLQQATDQMQSTVSVLLALAREESLHMQKLLLRPIVEESILHLHHALDSADFAVQLTLDEGYQVEGNQHLISLLVINLVENAMRYAAQPQLDIILDGNTLRFENRISSTTIVEPLKPASRQADSEGLGQGLFLVKRIAERLGWQLSTCSGEQDFAVILKISP